MTRPSIPAEVARAILIEAGHRCAVCGVPCPLERAHIVPWSQSRDHTVENLICLCANCHERADLEGWGVSVLRQYKSTPWVARQNNSLVQALPRTQVLISIEKEIEDFDDHDENMLKHALASFLDIPPSAIRITSKERGSVKIRLELPTGAADTLIDSFMREDPKLFAWLPQFPIRDIVQEKTAAYRLGPRSSERPIEQAIHLPRTSAPASPERAIETLDSSAAPEVAAVYEDRFQEIFRTYYKKVLGYFVRRGLRREEAEDLAQEAFIRVYKGLGAFRGDAALSIWLFRIAANVWRSSLRDRAAPKRSSEEVGSEKVEAKLATLDELRALDDALQNERRLILTQALTELPPRMRRALLLRVAQDRSVAEIADLQQTSIQTVRAQLHHARRQLRERLGAYFEEIDQ